VIGFRFDLERGKRKKNDALDEERRKFMLALKYTHIHTKAQRSLKKKC